MSDRSLYSPSQLERINLCPASVQASEKEHTRLGTMKHKTMAEILTGKIDQKDINLKPEEKEQITYCLDYLHTLQKDELYTQWVEEQVSLAHLDLPEIYGTADLILETYDTLHIIDWKFGVGIKVYADHNLQLIAYALGALKKVLIKQKLKIKVHIVQPGLDHIDVCEYTPDSLLPYLEKLKETVAAAKEKNPKFNPGEIQCQWCKVGATCTVRYATAQRTAEQICKVHNDLKTHQVNLTELAQLLKQTKELKAYLSDLEEYVFVELQKGHTCPYFALGRGRGKRSWKNEKKTAAWIKEYTDLEPYSTEVTLLSPAKVENLKLKLKKDVGFQNLVLKEYGKRKLIRTPDKVDVVNSAKKVFKEFKMKL